MTSDSFSTPRIQNDHIRRRNRRDFLSNNLAHHAHHPLARFLSTGRQNDRQIESAFGESFELFSAIARRAGHRVGEDDFVADEFLRRFPVAFATAAASPS